MLFRIEKLINHVLNVLDAYAVPANFLEIDVVNPMTTITAGKKRYTDYEVRMRVSVLSTELRVFFGWHKLIRIIFIKRKKNYLLCCAH